MTRIIDKILHQRQSKSKGKNAFISLEFFPPKTESGMDNLLSRMDRMSRKMDPIFIDITWADNTSERTLAIASHVQRYLGVDVLMHLTCAGMTKKRVKQILMQAKSNGIQNILALKGDYGTTTKQDDESLVYAIDLVKYIRELHGDYFGIAVAGHPEGHPQSESGKEELFYLKQKIDAGADFIMTQFFYNVNLFLDYVKKCRNIGIQCPILPGIMPIQSYSTLIRMTDFCHISVPDQIMKQIEPVKDDDDAVKDLGCTIAKHMCEQILSSNTNIDGIHFYTLNLERSVLRIVESLPYSCKHRTRYPWKSSAMQKRYNQEEVRPINWANRPKSYVMRTDDWDEFPNGRWGDSTSPAFGDLSSLVHFYNNVHSISKSERRTYLGENPTTPQDIYNVFSNYVQGLIPFLPWCESELQPESFVIQKQLSNLNQNGFLTINSQPSVNGCKSDHPTFGWGGPGGYVYQKAYIEFFVHSDKVQLLMNQIIDKYPSISLYAVNNLGTTMKTNNDLSNTITALTWGVFPNREIIQPTIFDPSTFLVWAEEAFSLWDSAWLDLYDFESKSFELIDNMRDTFFLVAMVDNDFIDGNHLFHVLDDVQIMR